jgi:hypothetical protein
MVSLWQIKPHMKNFLTVILAVCTCCTCLAQHTLTKLWSSDTTLPVPESVLYDAQGKILYVSLIDGKPDGKDGKGGVAKVGLDGKIISKTWVTGLNAPKGLGKFGNILYAADITDVVVIDVPTGKVIKKIPIAGAVFLNDISVDDKGAVYVSDTQTGKVYKIENGRAELFVDGIKGANGVLAVGSDVYMLGNGLLFKAGAQKTVTTIATGMDASTDGVEQVKAGEFVVSCWNGVIYYVKADGSKQQLLDTRPMKSNTADIGYDAVNKIVYVPTFLKNSVVAYQLK